jgi:hypothetical protein
MSKTQRNPENDGEELVPIKMKKRTYRILKTVAAWRGVQMSDLLSEVAEPPLKQLLADVVGEIGEAAEPTPTPPPKKKGP